MNRFFERAAQLAEQCRADALRAAEAQIAASLPDAQVSAEGERIVITARRLVRRMLEQPALRFFWSHRR